MGAALYFDNPLSLQGQYDINITNCDFNENKAKTNGGAIFAYRSMNVFIDSSRFVANEATNEGGVMRYSSDLTIRNSEFYSNKAKQGGALTSGQKIDLNIFNSTFANNTASEEGGAIKACFFNINDAKFINNTAPNGGAIC